MSYEHNSGPPTSHCVGQRLVVLALAGLFFSQKGTAPAPPVVTTCYILLWPSACSGIVSGL